MKVDRAVVSRKFNLGNYETLDMGLEAPVGTDENPKLILAELREAIEMEYIDMQRPKIVTNDSTTIKRQAEELSSHVRSKPQLAPEPTPKIAPKFNALEPAQLEQVEVQLSGTLWIIRPRGGWITDKAEFAKITEQVKKAGGDWISDGKNSRWEIKVQ